MTDRELLELAAKAAGIKPKLLNEFGGYVNGAVWNPLADDGDAFRLFVKLKLDVQLFSACTTAWRTGIDEVSEDHGADPYAATRRAIVRAAAAVGQGKA